MEKELIDDGSNLSFIRGGRSADADTVNKLFPDELDHVGFKFCTGATISEEVVEVRKVLGIGDIHGLVDCKVLLMWAKTEEDAI